ncbi:unnamed protein product, partial [Gongylonema pulchrum]|uniref:BTB domain-containing protein n=1 Tax=Gongylonema pulchrum TaxID=637853 RepID=A0A183E174_9BILA
MSAAVVDEELDEDVICLSSSDSASPECHTKRQLQQIPHQQKVSPGCCSSSTAPMVYRSHKHSRVTLEQMNEMRADGALCDVTLVVGEVRINAHRLLLASCSSYFRAMFTSEMAESRQQEVQMVDIEPHTLQTLIEFCYTGEIVIAEFNVQSILPAACLLQLSEIQDVCCEFLKKQLDPTNCLGIRAFADTHACRDLMRIADKFTHQNFQVFPLSLYFLQSKFTAYSDNGFEICAARKVFQEVSRNEEFILLPLNQLIDLISSEELNVHSEETVFRAVLEHVRLPLCPAKFLVSVVSEDPLVKTDAQCRDLVDEAKNYLLLPLERANMQGPRTRSRKPVPYGEVLYAVGGWCSGDAIASVERMNSRTGEWHCVTPMSKRRCGVGVAVLDNLLYAVGGHDGQSYLNSVERYDPAIHQWSSDVAPTSTCRTSVGVAMLGGLLYAVGGQDGVSCLNFVERYDAHRNEWSKVAPMSTRRLGVSVSVLNGCLYAVGGSDGQNPLNTVERC